MTTVKDGARSYQVVFAGSTSINPGTRLVGTPSYPGIAEDFARAFEVLESLTPDVFLAAHTGFFAMEEKRARLGRPGSENPFVDPEGYRAHVAEKKRAFDESSRASVPSARPRRDLRRWAIPFPNGSSRWRRRSPRSASPARSGSSSASSTASACSPSRTAATSACSRATGCRRTIRPSRRAIADLPRTTSILDGEAAWDRQSRTAYHVFDILWLDGRSVTALPLEERRALLKTLPLQAPLARVDRLDDAKPWERACAEGWEGVIAKRRGSPYEHRRSPHWLKMKCEATQELVVGGFTDPQGARVGLGALLVGYYEGDDLVFAGQDRHRLRHEAAARPARAARRARDRRRRRSPRARACRACASHWVRPEIVVQVGFIEWTTHGKLRHPRLLGVRFDKAAREVVRETP